MKLLIIEDEKEILSFLKLNLISSGFVVDTASSGQTGLSLARENTYDIIILDLNLPDLSGQEVCEEIRSEGQMQPILVLSATDKTDTKIKLLNSGADDYITKPFSFEELVSRIYSLSRRPKEISSDLLIVQDIELDRQKQTVCRKGKEIYLTRKEFLLLEHMMNRQNTVISRGEIMEHVWDMEANFFSKTIETHILNLRKKLDQGRVHPIIKTVSGRGYKLG